MADNENEIGRRGVEQLSYGDQKRRLFLVLSTCLLMVACCVALLLKSVFNNPWIAISALLLPAIESQLALLFLDQIRSSQVFLILSFPLSYSTIAIAAALATPFQVIMIICSVNTMWGGLFQLGLDLVTPIQFPHFYGIMATNFISQLLKRRELVVWAWAYPVPVFLTIGMIVLQNRAADSGAVDGGEGTVAGEPAVRG